MLYEIISFLFGMIIGLIILIVQLKKGIRDLQETISDIQEINERIDNISEALNDRISFLEEQIALLNEAVGEEALELANEIIEDKENYERMLQKNQERIKRIQKQIDELFGEKNKEQNQK